jgi:hypothetical protein
MPRTRWLMLCPLLFVLVSPLNAAEDAPLAQIPGNAPLVLSLRGIKTSTAHYATMVKNALPDQARVLQTPVDDFLIKKMFEGRKLQGLKDDGPCFLAFLELPPLENPGQANVAFVLRVTDYKAFRDGFLTAQEHATLKEEKMSGWEVATVNTLKLYFIQRPDYVIVTYNPKTAAEFAKKEKGKGLDKTLSPSQAGRLLKADAALYLDMAAVTRAYEKRIKLVRQVIESRIDQAAESKGGKIDANQFEMIKHIYGALVQGLQDCTSLVLACDFRPEGLAVYLSVSLDANSKSNQLLKLMKPSPLAGLQSLPAGQMTYMAMDFGPEAYRAFHPILFSFFAASADIGDKDGKKAIDEARGDFLAAKPRQLLYAGSPGAGRMTLQIWQYDDLAKGADAQFKVFKALKEGAVFRFLPLLGKPALKENAQKYRSGTLHRATLKWDLEKMADHLLGGEEGSAMLKKLTGAGARFWFGNVDKVNVQISAKDWKTAEKTLDQYFGKKDMIGDSSYKGFAEARGHLPKEATFISLIHAPQYARYLAEYYQEAIKAQGGKVGKPPVEGENKVPDSYLGVAATFQAGGVSFDVWVPGAAAKEFYRLFEPLLKKLGDKK